MFRERNNWLSCIFEEIQEKLLRKEVIHPQIPLGIPCYDLVLIAGFTFDRRFSCELC